PGTGTAPLVLFNGGVGYCFAQGSNGGVARTTDLGATFDGIALINSNFGLVVDYWISPDCSVTYVLTDDGVDLNLWKKAGATWERVFILAAGTGQTWMVRADADNPDTVYLGLVGGVIVYKSLDGTVNWVTRAFASNMSDFVVQDANTLYASVQGAATVRKTDSGAFLWHPAVATGLALFANNVYSLTLIADDQLIAGGTAGAVAYTADGNTSWALVPALLGPTPGAGGVVATANGLATGNVIWAGDNAVGNLCSWTIGTNTPLTGWTTSVAKTANGATTIDGIAFVNDILYAWDDGNCILYRFLYPTIVMIWETDFITANVTIASALAGTTLNTLQYCTPNTNLWIRSAAGVDTMQSYTEYMIGPAMAPVPTYPINDTIIPVNSINGAVLGFNFQWTAPMGNNLLGYLFDIAIFLDPGQTILVGADTFIGLALFDGGVGSVPVGLTGTAAPAFIPVPGETYYWRVRVSNGFPLESYWSPLQTFSIEQLVAIVPVIASPANGSEVNTTTPGFSWSPITGANSYRFELATDADFTDVLYTADTASAGVSLPSTVTLERGMQYFWRVKTLTPAEGDWSAVANFIVAELPPETTPVVITTAPTPIITAIITQPAATTTVITVPPNVEEVVNPSYIWAIIVVGAVLVIAVIILIVRTRRTV
ncbi:MAG: hypothetical protein JXA17_01855, partial [Dehalococcoidales bacterium]|nr:hypothetical protein [Dehalococcoidales bacterium]